MRIYFLFILSLPIALGAQTDSLREVVITYQALKKAPVTYQNLTREALEAKSTGQEPAFLLAETPSVTSYSDGGGPQGYAYIRMRGIDQTRINFTLDGAPLNEPEDQGLFFSNYFDLLNSASKVQIQRGVGTTKHGVASFGGSVQLFSPDLSSGKKTEFGANYGAFGTYRAYAEFQSDLKKGKAVYARVSSGHSDGYKRHAQNDAISGFVSAMRSNDRALWKMNLLVGNQRNGLAWLGVPQADIQRDRRTNANSKQEKDNFTQAFAQLIHNRQIKKRMSFQHSIYYTLVEGDYDFDLNNFIGQPSTDELYNYRFLSHFIGTFNTLQYTHNHLQLVTGLHANTYARAHHGSERTQGHLYKNTGYKNESAAFVKTAYDWKRFRLTTDVQYRVATFRYSGDVQLPQYRWSFLNPMAGLSMQLHKDGEMYYSLAATGREPTRNDIFLGNDNLYTDSLGLPAIGVTTPEYVQDHEFGYRCTRGAIQFSANLFYMQFRNEIVLNGKFGPNGLPLTNSVEQSYRSGVEVHASWQIAPWLKASHQSAFSRSRISTEGLSFSPILTPNVIVNQEVTLVHKSFTLALQGRYQSASYIDFAEAQKINAYVLSNARLQYNYRRMTFSLFANNLTNARYYNNGYVDFDGQARYFVQAGRHFHVGFRYVL